MISISHLVARVSVICLLFAFLGSSNGGAPIEPNIEPLDSYYDKETDIIKMRILTVRAETLGIKRGEDVECVGSKDGRTLLMDCAAWGTKDDILKLILYGAKVNAKDKKGRTPLIAAAYNGRMDAVRVLLQAGAKVDMRDNQGWTPLMYAVAHGRYGAVKELIKGKADLYADCFGEPILYWAKGDVKMIELLCLAGARVNALDSHGWTPLMYAAYRGDVEAAKALVKGGANTEIVLKNGHIPLTYFTAENNLKAVKTLIKADANVNAREKKENATALLLAYRMGYEDISKTLIQAGADGHVLIVEAHKKLLRQKEINAKQVATQSVKRTYDTHGTCDADVQMVATQSVKRTYFIDLVISGARDYLNTKNLDFDINKIYANPSLYYMFEQDPATWKVGHLLYTLDGSDPLLNPTYIELNPELLNPQLPVRETKKGDNND